MKLIRDGIAAASGIVIGPAYVLKWEVPPIPQASVPPGQVEAEVERFIDALEQSKSRIRQIQRQTAERLGPVEAQIFEPQVLMLEDPDLVDGTVSYIRDNHLSAARAFELRMLELTSEWRRSGHPMIMDRLNDLADVEVRVVNQLLGREALDLAIGEDAGKVILVARELTPTLTAQLDRGTILGIATDHGTRTSHSAILARSLNIPAVVNLGDLSELVSTGQELILDGRAGRVIVEPSADDVSLYRERDIKVRQWEQELVLLAHLEPVTPDRQRIVLRANIDLPSEIDSAKSHGAQGIGLFRTEFLVIGRSTMPEEEDQYRSYRRVVEAFPEEGVYIRTYDLGGDKFPLFLNMPPEENPFLGWRAIRVCLDTPQLFIAQLRAILRAAAHGNVRIMLPLINEVDEVRRTRELLSEAAHDLTRDGMDVGECQLGIMVETPAAALNAAELARHADFFSIGTNDLVQYTLAVDRGNARLARLYTAYHPSVLRLLEETVKAGRNAGIDVSVCGELAASPLGVFTLLGLGITDLSVGPASLSEIKKVIRAVPVTEARRAVASARDAASSGEALRILTHAISEWLDLSVFSGRWNPSPAG